MSITVDTNAPGTEMPRYKCHKEVWALQIAAIEIGEDRSAKIAPADKGYGHFWTKPNFPFKGGEGDLGYYVQYADGYESWSPKKAFEEGYTRIIDRQPAEPETLGAAIQHAINCHSAENGSNTPDWILAAYLMGCLTAFDTTTNAREKWYGREAAFPYSQPTEPAVGQPGPNDPVSPAKD